jgi:hypothetical protein
MKTRLESIFECDIAKDKNKECLKGKIKESATDIQSIIDSTDEAFKELKKIMTMESEWGRIKMGAKKSDSEEDFATFVARLHDEIVSTAMRLGKVF